MIFFFLTEFSKIGVLFFFTVFLSTIIIAFSYLFSFNDSDTEKLSTYECGIDPYEDA